MNETFENLPVSIDTLPDLPQNDFNPIEKAYLKVSLISSGVFFVILLIGAFCLVYFNSDEIDKVLLAYGLSIGSIGLLWLANIIFVSKAFPKKKYALRERDIIYMKGLLWSTRTSIPFNRIQHVEVKQGPFERFFKLNSLKVFTAGGQTSDLVIPGLSEEKALRLKEFILGKTSSDGVDS